MTVRTVVRGDGVGGAGRPGRCGGARPARAALLFSCVLVAACGGPPSVPLAELSPDQWEEDLDFVVGILEAEHPDVFGYHGADPAAFRAEVARLRGVARTGPVEALLFGLDRLVAGVGDGHTSLDAVQARAGLPRLPLAAGYFGDEVRVFAVHAGAEDALGARILAVEGTPVAQVMTALSVFISRDNPQELRYFAPSYLVTPEALRFVGVATRPDTVVLTLGHDSATFDLAVAALPLERYASAEWIRARPDSAETPLFLQRSDETYWFEYLPDRDAVYVNWDRVDDADDGPSLRRFYGRLFDVLDRERPGRLIVDLRDNSGGNFLKANRFLDGLQARPWLTEPGGIYVLTASRTFSAATHVAARLRFEANARIVGEASRGNPNYSYNAETVLLPNSGLHMEYTDRLHERPPFPQLGSRRELPVDVPVHNTFRDYASGRDRVLEAALPDR